MHMLSPAVFVLNKPFFFKKKLSHFTIRVSYSLDPGQPRRIVGTDLRPNLIQILSAG